jgi:hypothetical protein
MSNRLKSVLVCLAVVIGGEMLVQQMNPPTPPQPDSCQRKRAAAVAQDVDGGRYNVDELCKTARKIDAMIGG